jgi:hypothetical protein
MLHLSLSSEKLPKTLKLDNEGLVWGEKMGVLHIILKVGHPKIISTQISEQKILM